MSVQHLNSQSCQTLADWLCYIEQSHPIDKIELGLERVQQVAARGALASLPGKVVLIAGTNGKGTTARTLEQLLLAQGHSVGVYSSPHLLHFNERLRINNQDVADDDWLAAFALVESLRQTTPLTYFEFTTLVAFAILRQMQPEYCLIEVGLGGRLDATNIIEPDISVITTIGLDHQDWLGNDRESIGREKAGVFRAAKVAISGELAPPASIAAVALHKGAELLQLGQHFNYQATEQEWHWQGISQQYRHLMLPWVPVQNVATSLAVLEQLHKLPAFAQLQESLQQLKLPGRMQLLQQTPDIMVDVAHNPQSAAYLASQLQRIKPGYSKVLALVGMLKDKDITHSLSPLTNYVDEWHLVSLPGTRGADSGLLVQALQNTDVKLAEAALQYATIQEAYPAIVKALKADELLVIFGSFVTVSAVLTLQQEGQ
ncbi:bifunctional folylpolyglutamate synthase/dihydrofolate synthase [Alishewanella longhuensis]|uniref:Dihydrofolate synthase/folylpolyglutamate synthase n=1 Tax=Alishewanella longhuensis TaxID=1091037 RepID=A0ABQ3KW78_9ALTE|nr:bifunctional tetrahydrofolate synthase/dihydrofolate synthase [Alishewanella longhuensis]GHG64326.1 bifunctional folylpolyglutamate synthase/dihydrofolate synthase [Alishewanella longhuensis]